MPYLTEQRKTELDSRTVYKATTAGDLTYLLTKAVLEDEARLPARLYECIDRFMGGRAVRYEDYATVIGSLVCTGMEYERRVGGAVTAQKLEELMEFIQSYYTDFVAPYEDEKIEQNGDVYL